MEVIAGDDYELMNYRRSSHGMFYLVYEKETRSYLYVHHKNGVQVGVEYAGTEQADAIAGFAEYIAERSAL